MRIREPIPADAADLGRIHVEAWQVAYRGMMPDDYLDGLSVDDRVTMWQASLERPLRERRARFVADDQDDRTVGFILTGPADGEDDSGVGEVYVLNVDPGAWGRGAGRALIAAGVDTLAAHGFEDLILWVHPDNLRARQFYERAGWACEGTTRIQEVHGIEVPEVRYRRSV